MINVSYENKSSGHGGKREGAGRKPKEDEVKLIERLSPMDDLALQKLRQGMEKGDFNFIKMFFEYRFGKAKEKLDVTSNGHTITAIKLVDVDGTEI